MDEQLKELGFTDEKEYFSLVSTVPLTSSKQLSDFNNWKFKDGTKDGLMKLFNND